MKITDNAIILDISKFQESSLILTCFLESKGVMKGLYRSNKKISGRTNKGDIVQLSWHGRLQEQLGTYSIIESHHHVLAKIIMVKELLFIMTSALEICKNIPEREQHLDLYNALSKLLLSLYNYQHTEGMTKIYKLYVLFELSLLKELGFGLNLTECVVTKKNSELFYISPKSGCSVSREAGSEYHDRLFLLPQFFLNHEREANADEITEGFRITEHFLDLRFREHYNTEFFFPQARKHIISDFSAL